MNKEEKREYDKMRQITYRVKNKEREKAKAKAYYIANKEKIDARVKIYANAHKEEIRIYHKAWHAANKEEKKKKADVWRIENPEKVRMYVRKKILKEHGLTLADYAQMLEDQDGRCKICGKEPGTKVLVVDHNHQTGKIRGLLCRRCNMGLGHFEDDLATILKAAAYLEENNQ